MAGRPREFDREVALRKAEQVFWQRGYEGTSMSDLVAALGIASARIYAAFGSKENLFREAIALYLAEEGAFADAALQEPDTRSAIKKLLTGAVDTYTRDDRPHGCMVVLSLTNYSADNEAIMHWLADHRRERTNGIIQRLRRGTESGDLPEHTDTQSLGDYVATLLHGISVQARDGVSRDRLLAMTEIAMHTFDLMTASPATH
ncbi:TetR/AcrR family transcriptional regulator [Morganella morganii]|uniref:TetR/AcrR family transcriptional regulator n=1 Tax=Morganella morganii TaxID=582 RepID=UPI0017E8DEFE|nr:TetR/AcrR family transcriptional regulator [Morganella morganii]HAG7876095.1 TetR/AcrR family transcriptional regulator [Escherichia coli]EKT0591048.1 TetR/AcrR family transcriptional regulator [Morganella morganii]EKT0594073.1 TetR/AcrR family transcriptional regulator [Morganella morganii]MBT0518169.1 TetR/AcrR family transcriptional regulator [Morganella morganii subsp. morganii]QWL91480.1 TetR/AcrR family transcriptional regulator [Morganella morganii subsp. morganii]